MWSAQLLLAIPFVAFGMRRLLAGESLGSLMLPAFVVGLAWVALIVLVVGTRRGREWIRMWRYQLLVCAVTAVLATAVIGEAGVRIAADSDVDGNVFVRGHHLAPRRFPVKRVEAAAHAYLAAPATSFMMADPLLGWVPRPGVKTSRYTYNADGIRVTSPELVYEKQPPVNTLRIALFGDSFTNGAEVLNDETWGVFTEAALRESGRAVEVLNFGVNGYGMDQAYLRWRYSGAEYKPDVVVFGLQLENAKRNTNLIRPMYTRTTENLPFAKPRFVLEGGELRLINSPVVSVEQLPQTLQNFDAWPLAKYQAYYDRSNYAARPWSSSKSLTFAAQMMGEAISKPPDDDVTTPEERALAIAILEAFKQSVEATGAKFLVYYLPKRHELRMLRAGKPVPDDPFLQMLAQRFEMLSVADALQQAERSGAAERLYRPGGHFTPEANKIVAQVLAQRLSSAHEAPGKTN